MKVALLTTDSREHFREYVKTRPYFGTAPEALLQGFAGLPAVEVHVISCHQEPMISEAKIAPNIFYHGLRVPKLGWLRTAYQGCIRAVRRKLRELRPDIVHGQGTERDCALSAALSGFPNVITIHGNVRLIARLERSPLFSYWWLAARLEAFTIPRSGGVVCITGYTDRAVAGLARRTWVVPNAVDASFFDLPRAVDPAGPPVVLCVGNICSRKNQNDFIRLLDPVATANSFEVRFLGGANEEDAYVKEFFQLVGQRPWCRYGGFAGREALKRALQSATALALPTREDNCPMVVLEAMAAGVPVAASNVGGIPDLIEHERTGLLFDPDQPEAVRHEFQRLLAEPASRARLADAARHRARERFHPRVVAQRHLEIYREVLNTRS